MKKILIIITLLIMLPISVYASNIEVKSVSVTNISNNVREGKAPSFDKQKVNLNVRFCDKNQVISYKVILHNSSKNDYEVSAVETKYKTGVEAISSDSVIKAGTDKEIIVTLKAADISQNNFKEDITFDVVATPKSSNSGNNNNNNNNNNNGGSSNNGENKENPKADDGNNGSVNDDNNSNEDDNGNIILFKKNDSTENEHEGKNNVVMYVVIGVIVLMIGVCIFYIKKDSSMFVIILVLFLSVISLSYLDGSYLIALKKTATVSNETININASVLYITSCEGGGVTPIVDYKVVTDYAKTTFYKYGTFTTKGLELLEDNKIVNNFNPELIEVPNLQQVGSKTVRIKYNGKELSYNINVRDNKVGDLITLKDGSRWYYLANKNNEIHLLSVYELKEQCKGSCILTFTNNKDPYDSYWTTKFDESNRDYDNSSIKSTLYNKFKTPFLSSLNSLTGVDTSSIKIDLPDAALLSELLGGNGNDGYVTGDGLNRYVSTFLKGYKTYWTKTTRNANAVYTVHESNGRVGWAINNKTANSYAIRPVMIVQPSVLEQLVVRSDNNTDGQLDLVSSLSYIIYDVNNDKIIREVKRIDERYINGRTGEDLYLGPNTTDYLYPASVTKITTAMYALEKINTYGISLDTPITIDPKVKQCGQNFYGGGGNTYLANYTSVTYRDLLYTSLYASSWDATVELAILLANRNGQMGINKDYQLGYDTSPLNSSVYADCEKLDVQFANEMNDYVNKKVLRSNKNTSYKNTSGFLRDGHYTTLYDVSLILSYAMKNPTFKNLFTDQNSRKTYTSSYAKYVENGTEKKLTVNNPSSPLFGLDYMIGGKIGNASHKQKGFRSGHNWALYYEKDGHGYVIFTAMADTNLTTVGNLNMINDQFLIYQWVFR